MKHLLDLEQNGLHSVADGTIFIRSIGQEVGKASDDAGIGLGGKGGLPEERELVANQNLCAIKIWASATIDEIVEALHVRVGQQGEDELGRHGESQAGDSTWF